MKKALLVLAVCGVWAMTAQGQKVKFGAKAGLNLSMVNSNDPEVKEEGKTRPTFHVGGVADISLGKSLSLQPQLLLSGKGTNLDHGDHTDKFIFTTIDLPINLVYRSKGGFFAGGGPNIGFNVNGKFKSDEPGEESFDFKFGSGEDEIKGLDLGFNFLAGYQAKGGLFASVNFLAGMTNWSNGDNDTWRNNVLGVSVGYMFGSKKKK